jgi:hypothetical protein
MMCSNAYKLKKLYHFLVTNIICIMHIRDMHFNTILLSFQNFVTMDDVLES